MERYEIVVDDEGNYCGLIPSENGPLVQYADAQATIAALQARVQELEQAAKETHGRFISEQAAKKDVIDELTVALKSDADGQVLIDKLMQDVLKLESQLTQRTAELESAQREARLQKEVEAALSSKVVEYEVELNGDPQNFYGRGRTVGLRTLVLALPKVEGELTCSQQFDSAWRLQYWQVEAYGVADECLYRLSNLRKEEANAYAALLQHRQGMEG